MGVIIGEVIGLQRPNKICCYEKAYLTIIAIIVQEWIIVVQFTLV